MTISLSCLLVFICFTKLSCEVHNGRPKITTADGDLILKPSPGKNLYLRTNGPKSRIFIDDTDIFEFNLTKQDQPYHETFPNNNEIPNSNQLYGPDAILRRLHVLEETVKVPSADMSTNMSLFSRRINRVQNEIRYIKARVRDISRDKCSPRPCLNEGTCLNLAVDYHCLCPSNWEGKNCDNDVNECRTLAGTDLGCQNGATCINKNGTYECLCRTGWYGIHCTRKAKDCYGGDLEMCGYGTCIPTSTGDGIKCICNQGWTSNSTSGVCDIDINECESGRGPHCSVNPKVKCINKRGSFRCGPCPPGYEGDGYICSDIDECDVLPNGGCSTRPMVPCYNTIGSRMCGPCPPGYQGDGATCSWIGSCSIDHGGCHPDAKCIERPNIGGHGIICLCPEGLDGDGFGLKGCYVTTESNSTLHCELNPCGAHGRCHALPHGYTCFCDKGYGGADCGTYLDYCSTKPCLNGGTCTPDDTVVRGFRCECTVDYSGPICQLKGKVCGGILNEQEGSIRYLHRNYTYLGHNPGCAWVIVTDPYKVINVTFSKFDINFSRGCGDDFLQINSGLNSAARLIGRFCGTDFPNDGNIISSGNSLYLWFNSISLYEGGFAIHWTSITPECGGEVNATTHGLISSPGWPGKYPPNQDCYWHLTTLPGKRLQLHFFQLEIESHVNCSFDYLALYDGKYVTDPLLNKYCNSTHPSPIHSSGSEMLIQFHADYMGSGNGFQISYAPTEGIPGCGGLYTAAEGEISSPSINGKYINNVICDYLIRASPNDKIRIEFKTFKLERSIRCKHDYVKIYDGESTDARFVGKFCGHTHPNVYLSSSNVLKIIFKTDIAISGEGFKILFESICHQTFDAEIFPHGLITSPGYPNTRISNRVCEYIIKTAPGKAIQLGFQDFDIETVYGNDCDYANVEVRDGPDANSTSLGRFCGGSEYLPPVQTSSFNFMYVRFTSDVSISGTGFIANFTTIPIKCGGIFRNSRGVIDYPSISFDESENDLNCTWILISPPGNYIEVTWKNFDISCSANFLKVTEIDDNNVSNEFGTFCKNHPPPTLTTLYNRLKIELVSSRPVIDSTFSLSYSFLNSTVHCGGSFLRTSGYILSPNWPNPYDPNIKCEWLISVPFGQKIKLNISTFDLTVSIGCNEDYLEIRNGRTSISPLIGKFCGKTMPRYLISLGNSLYVQFSSNNYREGKGFKIEWDGTVYGCGGSLTQAKGTIESPNYPQHYSNNAECFYKITTSSGSRLRIQFNALDIEESSNCVSEHIEIYDGRDSTANVIGRYCSLPITSSSIETSSSYAFIKFRSSNSIGRKGFSLNYDTICRNNITGDFGVIESPNYPSTYPSYLNCLWIISAPKGNRINVSFTHMNIGKQIHIYGTHKTYGFYIPRQFYLQKSVCQYDYLQIKGYLEITSGSRICGNTIPPKMSTQSNMLEIKFVTGSRNYFSNGFRLEWLRSGCGAHLFKNDGSFKLPKEMNNGGSFECEWIIETTLGTAIDITFYNIYMMESQNCTEDAIELYESQITDSSLITKVCQRGNFSFSSSTNIMFIRFVKSSDYRDVAFAATYKTIKAKCGYKLDALSGNIQSPNYPNNYDNNMFCIWHILVPKNHIIELNILELDLYSSTDDYNDVACKDFIKIYDTPNKILSGNYTYIICAHTRNKKIISKNNELAIQFASDSSKTAKGFKASYFTTCGSHIIVHNDGILTNDKLSHISPNRSCVWTIAAANIEQKISFTLKYMYIPRNTDIVSNKHCPSSYLRIYDGDDLQAPLAHEYCGRKVPPMIVSHGNSFTIELGSYLGIVMGDFTAHYTTIDTACGGTLISEEGSIASPNYPNAYPDSISCEWIISTSPGNEVYFNFETFNIEKSDNCNEDYLELRQNNGTGPIIGIYCGNDIPVITAIASKIYVKFHTDLKGSSQGFLAHYGFNRNNNIENEENGEISSPLYPHTKVGPGEYTWRVITNSKNPLTITIDDLEIVARGSYCHLNFLSIYDGYGEASNLLTTLCGLLDLSNNVIKTSSGVAFLKLKLDESNFGSKFHLLWSTFNKSISEEKINCGSNDNKFISPGDFVTIKSPSPSLGRYNNLLNCEWYFQTTPGSHLEVLFSSFHLNQHFHCDSYVTIYGSRNGGKNWKIIKAYLCEPNIIDTPIRSHFNYIKIKFISYYATLYKGFEGRVGSYCGGQLTDSSAYISVNWAHWSKNANQKKKCDWKVTVRPGRTIRLEIQHFNISNYNSQCMSYVQLFNGESKESPLLAKYCGYSDEKRNKIFTTSGNSLFITYFSKTLIYQSFKVHYEERNIECGATSKLDNDRSWEIISSPRYPSVPPPYSECIWIFTGPPGEILRIDFIDRFDLEHDEDCSKESVDVRDGASETSLLKGHFCQSSPSMVKSSNNVMYIKYFTQMKEPRNGFKANVSIDICGGTLQSWAGDVYSPGYPHMLNLPVGIQCEWKIIGIYGSALSITPLDVNLPESATLCGTQITIEQFNSETNTMNILKTYCNNTLNALDVIQTMTNEVSFKLRIGKPSGLMQVSNYKGFHFKFNSSQNCGSSIEANEGFIITNGYPMETTVLRCSWTITALDPLRRVSLELLDTSLDTSSQRILIFNDNYRSKLYDSSTDKKKYIFESSGRRMTVTVLLLLHAVKHRFKARFTTYDLLKCGGIQHANKGEIVSPENIESYYCNWQFTGNDIYENAAVIYKTLYVVANISLESNLTKAGCSYSDLSIEAKDVTFVRNFCNTNEKSLRIPSINVDVIANQMKHSFLRFHILWKKQPCGGLVEVGEELRDILKLPSNYEGSLDCAWILRVQSESRIKIKLEGSFSLDCSDEFLSIGEGWAQSSYSLGDYCQTSSPVSEFRTHFKSLYIQYHSSDYKNTTTIKLSANTVNTTCGGYLHNNDDHIFMSQNFPKSYIDNQECSWEIQTDLGFRIKLEFIERFAIEYSQNCTNDAVIIYDWINDEFIELGKVCGRDSPQPFNSTGNILKVVFRTNSNINLDGFKAHWTNFCGGSYIATETEQVLYSPGYPNNYPPSISCSYYISTKLIEQNTILKISDFNLEGTYPYCSNDKLSIDDTNSLKVERAVYCGSKIPKSLSLKNEVTIYFTSDKALEERGFQISFKLLDCNLIVTEPTTLTEDNRMEQSDCTWTIKAPIGKVSIITFYYIKLMYFSSIYIYDGSLVVNNNLLALISVSMNSSTTIRSTNQTMVIQFYLQEDTLGNDFKADVYFSYAQSVGCGGEVKLVNKSSKIIKSPLINSKYIYEPFLDCLWIIKASHNNVVQLKFSSFNIAPCENVNQTALGNSNCNCDFIEIIDGINPDSLVIGKYCGHNLPPVIVTSGNQMNLRLYTDGDIESSGFTLELSAVESECERTQYNVTSTTQNIRLSKFEAGIPQGLHCTYYIYSKPAILTHIKINTLDLLPRNSETNICDRDRIVLTEVNNYSSTTGYRISSSDSFLQTHYRDLYYPKNYIFCGVQRSIDLYTYSDLKVTVQTSAEPMNKGLKGVDIEIRTVSWCSRNYTDTQGRIKVELESKTSSNCNILITALNNYTISVYIYDFSVYSIDNKDGYVEFVDGNSSKSSILTRMHSASYKQPVFTTGRYLLIRNIGLKAIDMNYVTTNKGRGCGGQIQNVVGIVTSPMYPEIYRKVSTCEWELETPFGSRVIIHFLSFDLGPNCDQNYVNLVNRDGKIFSTYCEESPREYQSADNYVKIVYVTSTNNAGRGWEAEFVATA